MRKQHYLTQCIGALILLLTTSSVFAMQELVKEKNTSLSDSRVPTPYLPLQKLNVAQSVGYVFVDRTSVKLHPYNNFIRTYIRVVNYDPALMQEKDDKTVPYHSIVIQEFANCDKKEYAKGLVETYEDYFGTGTLQESNNLPKRWESTISDNKERQNLTIICSLPLFP